MAAASASSVRLRSVISRWTHNRPERFSVHVYGYEISQACPIPTHGNFFAFYRLSSANYFSYSGDFLIRTQISILDSFYRFR